MTATSDINSWLLHEARSLWNGSDLVSQLAERLVAAGVPLWRITINTPQLHPQLSAIIYEWRSDRGHAIEREIGRDIMKSRTFLHSPPALMMNTGKPVRRRLAGPDAELDFPVLEGLAAEGATDYYIHPLNRMGFSGTSFGIASKAAGGFSDEDIALVSDIGPTLALVLDAHVVRATLRGLLHSYVGRDAGEQVLRGRITLGATRVMNAVIWCCDLRRFTDLTEANSNDVVMALLNDYFGAMVRAVHRNDGEVLKFIGDGMLAIFRITEDRPAKDAVNKALKAVDQALSTLETANADRATKGLPIIRIGIGMHLGEVAYGNIGADDRLDFTVIGPNVNRAARIEGLTKDLGVPVLVSQAIADTVPTDQTIAMGTHMLKGIADPQAVFALADHATPQGTA